METKEILKNLKDISESKNKEDVAFNFKNIFIQDTFNDRFDFAKKYKNYNIFYYEKKDYMTLNEEQKKCILIKFSNNSSSSKKELNLKTNEEIKEFFDIYYKLMKNNNLSSIKNNEKFFLFSSISRFGLRIYDDIFKDIFNYARIFNKNFWMDVFLSIQIDSEFNNEKDNTKELNFIFKKIFRYEKPLKKLIYDNNFSKELLNLEKEMNVPRFQLFLFYIRHNLIRPYIKILDDYLDELVKSICSGEIKNKKDISTLVYFLLNEFPRLSPEQVKDIKNSDTYQNYLDDTCYEKIVALKDNYWDFACFSSLIKEQDLLNENSLENIKSRFLLFVNVPLKFIAANYLEFLSLFKKESFSYKNIIKLILISNSLFNHLKLYNFLNEEEKGYFNKYAFEIINETENFKKPFFLRLLTKNRTDIYYTNAYNRSCINGLKNYLIDNLDKLDKNKKSTVKKIIIEEKL